MLSFRAWLGVVLAVAGAVRFWGIWHSGFTHWDEHFFVDQARRLAAGDPDFQLGWFGGPLLSLVMAGVMKIFGPGDMAALSVPAAAGTLACVATAALGRACWNARTGILAGLLLALSPFAFMYSRIAIAESLFLLLFVLSVWLIWLAAERQTGVVAVVGGVVAGLASMTKFNGVYTVALLITWLGALWLHARLTRLRRGPGADGPPTTLTARRLAILTVCWLAGFAVVVGALLPLVVPKEGLGVLITHFSGYSHGTDAAVILTYLLIGGTASTVALACLLGLAVAAGRRSSGGLFLLLVTVSFFVSVTRYLAYPRLGLPLMPLAMIFAAGGIDWIAGLLRARWPRPVFVPLCALLVVPQLWMLWPVARLRTRGYADVAAVIDRQSNVEIWTKAQPALYLYTTKVHYLDCNPDVVSRLARPVPRLFVFDQVANWTTMPRELLTLNGSRITGEETMSNPMYLELLLQPFEWDRWERRHNPALEYRVFRLIRTEGSLVLPPACDQR